MNLVAAAMRRPITILVLTVGVMLGAGLAWQSMPRDIFPDLGIPVIYVAQPYGGMDPQQMEGFLVNYYEYHFLYITGIEHVESRSIQGVGLIKLQFHPGTNMAQAVAETISYVDRARAFMPPGTVPPFVMRFDAGSVPVGTLVFESDKRTAAELQDLALFRVRPLFATLPGVSAPPPFGASQRTIVVKVDPERLRAYGLSPDEVVNSLSAANTITPSGNLYLGTTMPMVPVNGVVTDIRDLGAVPVRPGSTHTVYLRDIARIEDGSDLTTGYALVNGHRTVYIPVTKRSDASTLAVVDLVRQNLSRFQSVLPDDVHVSYQFDQSGYVTHAIAGLTLEGLLGACLTGLMVLLFLRDWRSVVIVVANIPLSLLFALVALWACHQTINIMTLGGLALAVGILVDEATVTVENFHTHLARGKSASRAALDATFETALPRLLAMLCVLAVFIPAFFMTGAIRALFVPLSLAVGFSMVGSYFLSSTFVPVLAVWLAGRRQLHPVDADRKPGLYARLAAGLVRWRWILVPAYLAGAGAAVWLVGGLLGTEIFPPVDTGQFQLRLRAPTGTRIERTEALFLATLESIQREAGPQNVDISLGFVGVQPPNYPINTIYLWTGGPEEAVLQIALKPGAHLAIEPFKERLRRRLARELPEVRYSFEPGDIVSRIMSFGARTPVEVVMSGPNLDASRAHAARLMEVLSGVDSLRDLGIVQNFDYPTVRVDVGRERAGIMGVTTASIARSVVAATSSSRYVTPNFWADPKNGVGYQLQVEIPQGAMDSLEAVRNLMIGRPGGSPVLQRNLAQVQAGEAASEYDRYNMQRMVTISANTYGEDLGRTAKRIAAAVRQAGAPPPKVTVAVRGQITPLQEMMDGLRSGIGLAVVVVFLLLAAHFQSLRLSLVVVSTVPAVLAGVAVSLWVTHTTLNVQSFMGAIMAVGVSVANAILQVTFAERRRVEGAVVHEAAVYGAQSRLRPILMTSFAMVAGMIPVALGLGEGGDQTAPLGRAVVGGLIASTLATLLVLPSVFALVQGDRVRRSASVHPDDLAGATP